MSKDLPILWWMDAKELTSQRFDPVKLQEIKDEIAAWEKDGNKTLNELKAAIESIIDRPESK